jgi:hypothetical protein
MSIASVGAVNRQNMLRPTFNWVDLGIAAVPLGIGGAIYLLFRSKGILIFQIADAVGLGTGIEAARLVARPLNSYMHGFVLYSLPTALWAFSFLFCIVTIWRHHLKSAGAICIVLLTISVVIGMELAQAANLLSGRFDAADLYANVMGLGIEGTVAYAKQSIKRTEILY